MKNSRQDRFLAEAPSAVSRRLGNLPAVLRKCVLGYFTLRRMALRLRYRGRVRLNDTAMLKGRLVVKGGTKVVLKDYVRVRRTVVVDGGGELIVGAKTLLNGCWITATKRVTVGEGCLISDCGITDSDYHNLDPELRHDSPGPGTAKPVHLADNVWVGAHALVLKGTRVEQDSVIGAGAVARGRIPERVVAIGNPAVVVKRL